MLTLACISPRCRTSRLPEFWRADRAFVKCLQALIFEHAGAACGLGMEVKGGNSLKAHANSKIPVNFDRREGFSEDGKNMRVGYFLPAS